MKRYYFIFLLILVFSIGAFGQSNWEIIEKYGNPKDYPDQDTIILYANHDVTFEADGSFVSTIHELVKILSPRGLKANSTQEVSYTKRYQDVQLLAANVYHENKTVESAPESAIKDESIAETQQMNIFEENFRKKTVNFANVAVGDTVEMHYRIKSKALVKDNFCSVFPLQSFDPAKIFKITINGPKDKPLHFLVKNGTAQFKQEENNNRILYTWDAQNVQPLKKELGMASPTDIAQKLIVSTYNNWEELSKYGASLNVGKIDSSPQMIKKVKELTKNATTEKDKIRNIFNFISTEVRYMGSSMDVGAFLEPHPASFTFEKKYGVCRDKSVLFISMLKEIGVKADDVLVNVTVKVDPEIPNIYFQHAIVAVHLNDGSKIYMDPTLELSTSFGEPYVKGKYVLNLTPEGNPLELVPQGKPTESTGRVTTQCSLNKDGDNPCESLKLKAEISGSGIYDLQLRTLGKQLPGFGMGLVMQQLLQRSDPNVKIIKVEPTDPIDLNQPFKISLEFEIPEYISQLGDVYMMKLPLGQFQLDLLLGITAYQLSRIPERLYPIFVFTPMQSETETEIHIPDEYEIVAYPDTLTFAESPFVLDVKITEKTKNTLTFTGTFSWSKDYISPQEYQTLKALMKKVDKFSRSMIILKKRS
ncbi:MAG: DUF3857 domain-containing transglutaminase family protein [Candidatus Omnitrophota bacterium]